MTGFTAARVRRVVNDGTGSPGRPLDRSTRAQMEARFQHDFSDVRVHTDARAADSANGVDALAYTAGRHLVFGAGQYAPQTRAGQRLLAHELTHVVQQKTMPGAAPAIFRRVGRVGCAANTFSAPADPRAALEAANTIAVDQANQVAAALATDAEDVKGGIPAAPSVTFTSYQNHFGLPVAAGKGFLNRLTGSVRRSQEIATSEELAILAKRFRLSARLLNQTVNFNCGAAGAANVALPGCGAAACGANFALSCRGGGTIALCPPFWDQLTDDNTRAAAMVHESTHILFGPGGGGALEQGAIGETTQRGSGRNFNIAGCYEFIVNDLLGIDSFPVCPDVPP